MLLKFSLLAFDIGKSCYDRDLIWLMGGIMLTGSLSFVIVAYETAIEVPLHVLSQKIYSFLFCSECFPCRILSNVNAKHAVLLVFLMVILYLEVDIRVQLQHV